MNLSFGHVWPAFVARRKTVTRRFWKPSHAKKFVKGFEFDALDTATFQGGQKIGTGRMTVTAYQESLLDMPDEDYAGEGFTFLREFPCLIPSRAAKEIWAQDRCSERSFRQWRDQGSLLYVARFEVLDVEPWAITHLNALLIANNHPPLRAN